MKRQISVLATIVLLFGCTQTREQKNESQGKTKAEGSSDFEFHGNYLPTKEFKINEHILKSIEIFTDNSLLGNKIEFITIRFRDPKSDNYYVIVDTKFEGTKDKFSIMANDSILGKIQIMGSFFGKLGPMNDNIKDHSTIVFRGTILANGINEEIECTYFEGD